MCDNEGVINKELLPNSNEDVNMMKNIRLYFDAHPNGEVASALDDVE